MKLGKRKRSKKTSFLGWALYITGIVIGVVLGICLVPTTIAVFVVVPRRRAAASGLEQNESNASPDPSQHYSAGFYAV